MAASLFFDKLKRKGFSGTVSFPTDKMYQDSLRFYNRALNSRPIAVLAPRGTSDVVNVIQVAREYKLPVSIKGGGHSMAGNNRQEGTVMLDMRLLDRIDLQPGRRKIFLQAGVLNERVDAACRPYHLALPLGTCKSVGVIGSTLGGGLGFLSRKYGLLCDNVSELTVVTGKGALLTVNKNRQSDLFQALKGGGAGQFGVVVSASYPLFRIPKTVFGGTVNWTLKEGKSILSHYAKVMSYAPDELFLYAYTGRSGTGEAVVSLFGFYLDDMRLSQRVFDEFKAISPPLSEDLKVRSYYELQSGHYEDGLSVCWRNRFLNSPLTIDIVDIILEGMARCPDFMGGIMLDPVGGAINRKHNADSVFVHRNSHYIVSITGISAFGTLSAETQQWVSSLSDQLMPYLSSASYQNYHATDNATATSYWGETLPFLKHVKRRFDPDNIIRSGISLF